MPYINLNEDHRAKIDLQTFAADLVKALNGLDTNPALEAKIVTDRENHYPSEQQYIDIVGGDRLRLSADNWKRRVRVSVDATDVPHGDRNSYAKEHRTESANVNPDGRKIESVAGDILRRVILPSRPALALQREYAVIQTKNRNGIVQHVEALRRSAPALSVRVEQGAQQAALYYNTDGLYISGRLSFDGSVSLDRLSSIPADKMPALIKLLNGGKKS